MNFDNMSARELRALAEAREAEERRHAEAATKPWPRPLTVYVHGDGWDSVQEFARDNGITFDSDAGRMLRHLADEIRLDFMVNVDGTGRIVAVDGGLVSG